MFRIRGRDTKPELIVRSTLHRLGLRFRLHSAKLPGKPDIVLARWRTVVLVHGCFWHRHEACRYAYTPKSRLEFWMRKFDENKRRDVRNLEALVSCGWRVITVWECETSHRELLRRRLRGYFRRTVEKALHGGRSEE